MGLTCPETLVNFIYLTPHNNPAAPDSNIHHGESMKSQTGTLPYQLYYVFCLQMIHDQIRDVCNQTSAVYTML